MKTDELAKEMINYLLEEGQEKILPDVSEAFNRLASQDEFNKKVVVTTAVFLKEEEKEEIKNHLRKIFGDRIDQIKNQVDKSILGGMKIRIGDVIIDATLKAQLKRLHDRLLI